MPQIGIDTNVFLHLVNPEENEDSHISRLLGVLIQDSYRLLVDSNRKIVNEYQQRIGSMIRQADETKAWLPLLRHWMNPDIRDLIEVDLHGVLMVRIKTVIHEVAEHADRAFVCVVCIADTTLVTNDRTHILNRRNSLLRETRRLRGKNTDIQSSQDAAVRFCTDA